MSTTACSSNAYLLCSQLCSQKPLPGRLILDDAGKRAKRNAPITVARPRAHRSDGALALHPGELNTTDKGKTGSSTT